VDVDCDCVLEKRAVGATGIPERGDYGDLSKLEPGQLVDLIIQRHAAQRAGLHKDIRLGTPETGLYSWATRKDLPKPGERRGLYQTDLHDYSYGDFQGTLYGYGAGTVRRERKGKLLITKVGPNKISFTTGDERYPQRYALIRPRGNNRAWILLNATPKEVIPYKKVHYTRIPADQVEATLQQLQPGSSVQAKIDGAASLVRLLEDGVEVTSYRAAKDGMPIVHTERIFGGRPFGLNLPRELVGSVLKGELYGVQQPPEGPEKVIPPQELGGLLNSTLANTLQTQKDRGIRLKNMLYDIQSLGGQDVDMDAVPYAQRLALVKEVIQHLPSDVFHAPDEANSPETATQLWKSIGAGQHPLTSEGIVIHPPTGKPSKAKFLDEQDVVIRGTFPGAGKYFKRGVGGFVYSLTPDGPILGRVGTGFDDDLRMDMYRDPEAYIGRTARVRSQGAFPESGALRAPSLLALHEG
jgi:hypothetical protein